MARSIIAALMLLGMLYGCGGEAEEGDLCTRFFRPYPDLVTGRLIMDRQKELLSGMEHYSAGRYEEAVADLESYVSARGTKKYTYLYLANSYLALGKPYEAELKLDHLENSNIADGYRDQTEWYTVLCWLCSDQHDRALKGAREIADGRRHTFQREAKQLVEALSKGS